MEYPVINMEATGARIKLLRLERNISVAQIASFMGDVSEQAVYKWQRGQTLPTVDNLFALSRLFETSMDNIIVEYEEDEKSSSQSEDKGRVQHGLFFMLKYQNVLIFWAFPPFVWYTYSIKKGGVTNDYRTYRARKKAASDGIYR